MRTSIAVLVALAGVADALKLPSTGMMDRRSMLTGATAGLAAVGLPGAAFARGAATEALKARADARQAQEAIEATPDFKLKAFKEDVSVIQAELDGAQDWAKIRDLINPKRQEFVRDLARQKAAEAGPARSDAILAQRQIIIKELLSVDKFAYDNLMDELGKYQVGKNKPRKDPSAASASLNKALAAVDTVIKG